MMYINSNEEEKDFIELYKKYYPKIYNYTVRRLFNKEQAEDITSTTFLKAFDYINKKNPEIKNFNAWIYKIATNEILLYHRNKGNKNHLSIDENDNNFKNLLENGNKLDKYLDFILVKKAMENLKPIERNVLELYYFENLDYSEISEILKIKEVSLRSIIHRTLKKLEKLLGGVDLNKK